MSPVAYANDIVAFMTPFLTESEQHLKRSALSLTPVPASLESNMQLLKKFIEGHEAEKKSLMDVMNVSFCNHYDNIHKVKRILFPHLSVNLTLAEIQYFNNLEFDDPQTAALMMSNEEYRVLSAFIDFYDQKGVVSMFIWSEVVQNITDSLSNLL
jgi:hypothetical protein